MDKAARWGVMATVDDIGSVLELDPDFVELLIMERDDLRQVESVLAGEREIIVHAPERVRYEGESRLLDLADKSPSRRQASVDRIVELAELTERCGRAMVVHPGGVLRGMADAAALKRNLLDSLSSIDGNIWMENMPRRYHCDGELLFPHLLLHSDDFDDVLPLVDGVTLDVCHAYLSVDRGGNSAIASFFQHLKSSIRHVHLSDASYPFNEGLPLGEGDIDLTMLPRMRGLPVLLEVHDGHLDGLAGHRKALEAVRGAVWFKGCIP